MCEIQSILHVDKLLEFAYALALYHFVVKET